MSHFFCKKSLIKIFDGFFLLLIVLNFFGNPKTTLAATYTWNQSDWSDGLDNGTFPNHTSNQTNWTKYFSKDSSVKSETGLITLSPLTNSVIQTSGTDFGLGATSSVVFSGSSDSGSVILGNGNTGTNFTSGNSFNCALRTNETVYCWGKNNYGQIGIGTTDNTQTVSLPVIGLGGTGILNDINSIDGGVGHACAVKSDGMVYCWGGNSSGNLGIGTTIGYETTPQQVVGIGGTGILNDISTITAGSAHTCAVKNDGTVYCWGDNSSGNLGIGTTIGYETTPQQVVGIGGTGILNDISTITAGSAHTCAVKNDGTVYCWGDNSSGNLGIGTTIGYETTPQQVVGIGGTGILNDINSITGGFGHTCALKNDGTIYCWGRNSYGQMGNNTSSTRQIYPVKVAGLDGSGYLTSVVSLSAGYYHTCAAKSDGTAYCWGQNSNGQIGIGDVVTPKTTIQQVVGVGKAGFLGDIISVSAGGNNSCAVKNNETIYCWGQNIYGQIGIGNTTNPQTSPNQVLGIGGTGIFSLGLYPSSGVFTSSIIDLGQVSSLTTLSFGATTPTNTTLKFQMRSAGSTGDLTTAMWYGPTGTDDYYTNTGATINSIISNQRYIQYKAFFDGDMYNTPALNDVTINYGYYQSGSLISSPYSSENGENLLSGISWIKNTPTGTNTKFQIKTANTSDGLTASEWKGPDGTDSTYFADNLGSETMPSAVTDGVNDQWIQYKAFLNTDNSSVAPTIYDITTTYVVNAPPSFDSTYQTNGFGITAGTVGTFNFLYRVGDTDTDQGSVANRYKLWPTFQYTLDNGSTWTTIADENLTGPNSSNPVTLISPSAYLTQATTWNAAADLPNSYNTVKIRMVINDHEAANNTSTITSDAFVVDTKDPEAGTLDGGGTGININRNVTTSLAADKTNSRNVTLYFSATDDSAIQLKYSTDANFAGASYQDYVASIGYTLPTSDGSKRVYVKFKDYYGNETESYSDVIELDTTSPTKPASLFIQDVSNTSINESRLFLNWEKNIDSDWLGYKIYRSTDGTTYNLQQTINNINTNYVVDTGVTLATNYFYKVTAVDDLINESVGSTISQTVGGNPSDAIAPTITNIQFSNKTTSSITITWTTNEVSNSTVLYSTDSDYDSNQGSSGYSLTHSVTLSGLTAGTIYNFKVRSSDPSGNATDSVADNFTTNTADVVGPIISNIGSTSITDNSAVIIFTTGEAATSFVEYSTTSGFSSGSIVGGNILETNHLVKLTSLLPGTTYYYKVRSSDINGNETVSVEKTLVTLANDNDLIAPVISSVSVYSTAYNTANIRFATNENTSSFVEFGRTNSYGRIYGVDESATSHSINLPYDLKPNSVYYYRVRAKDTSGNEAIGVGSSFITDADPEDVVSPTISNIEISEAGKNAITITWTTNEVADSYIGFSEDLTYSLEQGKPTMVTSHSVTLVGLKPRTKYYFRVKSADPSDNLTTDNNNSEGYTFVTADGENPPTIFANQIRDVGSSSAKIYWETNMSANSYVEYGLDESYGGWAGLNDSETEHEVQLTNLLSAATYNFRVRSKGASSGSEAVSQNFTLTTEGVATTAVGTTTTVIITNDPTETSILDSIKNGTADFVKKVLNIIPDTQLSESDFIDTMNSMSPKIVSSPSISAGNITVEPGVDKIIISWKTDKNASSLVGIVSEKEYNKDASDPYITTVGNPDESVTSHSVEISNLSPNTTYHYQVKSKANLGNWTKSEDYTFSTLSIDSEVRDLSFQKIGEKSISANWQTSFESRAMIEVIDMLTDKTVVKSEEKGFDKSHSFKTEELQTSTNYKLKIVTVAKDGTVSKESIYPFSTSTSSNPPEITNVRNSNALIGGAVEQVQTIISWKTDKPSTSKVIYDEGMAKELKLSTTLDKSLVTDHIVVATALKPGKIYKFKVESGDTNGNISTSKDYIIMTPKPQESVINLIIDNFTSSFSFITNKN